LVLPIGFAVLIGLRVRRHMIPYLCAVTLGVAPLFIFNRLAFGTWISAYYRFTQQSGSWFRLPIDPLLATLVSPSRGLFIFCPFLLFVFLRFLPAYRRRCPFRDIEIFLGAVSFLWWIGVVRWPLWWGGRSFGPRLLCELMPCLAILLIPIAQNIPLGRGPRTRLITTAFVITGILSVGIHLRGATTNAYDWNGISGNIDSAPQRVWSWKDAQFLYGLW